jgi:fermentation-respiration switch protein FrsA (DUF1100 family)
MLALLLLPALLQASPEAAQTVPIRGVLQRVMVYSPPLPAGLPPVVLTGGDGGWHGFIVDVAEHLARHGHLVVGVNAQDYLSSLSKDRPLEPSQVAQDYLEFVRFAQTRASSGTMERAILAGWSEGAGLAVLAAAEKGNHPSLLGVVTMGLPDFNELAWRLRDSIIFITKGVPKEKTFSSKDYVGRVAPVPLAMLQSTHDDFVPLATARELFGLAGEPKQLYLVDAWNHRFTGNREEFFRRLEEALQWIAAQSKR